MPRVDRLEGLWLHFGIAFMLGKVMPRKFIDGGRCSQQGVHGAPDDPVTNIELVAKFHALADRVTSAERATAIERAVTGLEDLDDITTLVDLLAAPVAGALD